MYFSVSDAAQHLSYLIDNAAEAARDKHDSQDNKRDDNDAEIRTGEISAVDVAAAQRKNNEKNETDDRDRKEDLIAEISPHTYGFVLVRNAVLIHDSAPLI